MHLLIKSFLLLSQLIVDPRDMRKNLTSNVHTDPRSSKRMVNVNGYIGTVRNGQECLGIINSFEFGISNP